MKTLSSTALRLGVAAGLGLTWGGIFHADASSPGVTASQESGATIVYSTYLGREVGVGDGIAVDERGSVYVTGTAWAPNDSHSDLPGPPYTLWPTPEPMLAFDGVVVGLDPDGRRTYLAFTGGAYGDRGREIAVDASSVYAVRSVFDWNISYMFYAEKLGRDTVAPAEYSAGWGLSHGATVNDIEVDADGNLYVAGFTGDPSYDWTDEPHMYGAAFAMKLTPSGDQSYFVSLGGFSYEEAVAIDVDREGNAYITGLTYSFDFPGFDPESGCALDACAFVAKLDPMGGVVYSTPLGGSGRDSGLGIAVDAAGYVFVAGSTRSSDFPVTADARILALSGSEDLFLANLDPSGNLVSATYLGAGGGNSFVQHAAFDMAGGLYVASWSYGGIAVAPGSTTCHDGFVARLELGSGIWTSLCLPGAEINDLAVDPFGAAYVTGYVRSPALFPVVDAFQPVPDGAHGFATKIVFNRPPDCSTTEAGPAVIWPPNGKLVPVAVVGVTDPDVDPVTVTVTAIYQDEPLTRPGTPDAVGIGTASPSVRAHREGTGDGRVYRLSFEARDDKGATCSGAVTVCVPHDGRQPACGDGGPIASSR